MEGGRVGGGGGRRDVGVVTGREEGGKIGWYVKQIFKMMNKK